MEQIHIKILFSLYIRMFLIFFSGWVCPFRYVKCCTQKIHRPHSHHFVHSQGSPLFLHYTNSQKFPNYQVVLVGHSLGAGTATLLSMLLYNGYFFLE